MGISVLVEQYLGDVREPTKNFDGQFELLFNDLEQFYVNNKKSTSNAFALLNCMQIIHLETFPCFFV